MRCIPARLLALVALVVLGGCGALGVDAFSGSWIAMSLDWPILQPLPPMTMGVRQPLLPGPTDHLELWAQRVDGSLTRLSPEQPTPGAPFPGFDVRWAIDPNEPCMIRALNPGDDCTDPARAPAPSQCGAHLLSADAQLGADKALQQMSVVSHVRPVVPTTTPIRAVGDTLMGKAQVPLLVLVRHGTCDGCNLNLTAQNAGNGADAAARQALCTQRLGRDKSSYYVGNPRQLTNPLNGVQYGFFNFMSALDPNDPAQPPQNLGGIALSTPTALPDVAQLFLTIEKNFDATGTAPMVPSSSIVVIGTRLPDSSAGRGAIRLALVVPQPMGSPVAVGTASVLTGLDRGL